MKEILSLLSGSILAKCAGLAVIPILYVGFSIDQLGQFDYILAGVALFEITLTMKLNEALLRYNSPTNYANSLSNLISILKFYSVIFPTAILVTYFVASEIIFLMLIIAFCRAIFTTCAEFYRSVGMHQKYIFYINAFALSNVIVIGCTVIFSITDNVIQLLIAQSILYSVLTIYILVNQELPLKLNTKERFFKDIGRLLLFAYPIVPSALSWWILRFVNRYYLMTKMGDAAVGQYAVINYLPQAIMISGAMVYTALQRFVYDQLDRNNNCIVKSLLEYISWIYFCAILIVVSISKLMIHSVPELNHNYKAFTFLILASAFFVQASNFALILTQQKRTKMLAFSTIIASLLCWGLSAQASGTDLIHYSFAFLFATLTLFFFRMYLLRDVIRGTTPQYVLSALCCLVYVSIRSDNRTFDLVDIVVVTFSTAILLNYILRIYRLLPWGSENKMENEK